MSGEFNKAIVALIMAALIVIEQIWGFSASWLTEELITTILAVLTPILIWLVPNLPADTPARTIGP